MQTTNQTRITAHNEQVAGKRDPRLAQDLNPAFSGSFRCASVRWAWEASVSEGVRLRHTLCTAATGQTTYPGDAQRKRDAISFRRVLAILSVLLLHSNVQEDIVKVQDYTGLEIAHDH